MSQGCQDITQCFAKHTYGLAYSLKGQSSEAMGDMNVRMLRQREGEPRLDSPCFAHLRCYPCVLACPSGLLPLSTGSPTTTVALFDRLAHGDCCPTILARPLGLLPFDTGSPQETVAPTYWLARNHCSPSDLARPGVLLPLTTGYLSYRSKIVRGRPSWCRIAKA